MSDTSTQTWQLQEGRCLVALTHERIDPKVTMDQVRDPKAGAIVLFEGTTRDNFEGKPVKELEYSSYAPLALRTMMTICKSVLEKHSLTSIAMIHRLGLVPIGEESIHIAVSSPHRQEAWRAGEEALEECKAKVEVWKKEEFGGEEGGVWRANRDGAKGEPVNEEEPAQNEQPAQDEQQAQKFPNGPLKAPLERGHGPVVHSSREEEPAQNEQQAKRFPNGPLKAPLERGHGPVVHPNRGV